MRTRTAVAAWMAALVLAAGGVAPGPSQAQGTPGSADFSISRQVESAFARERTLAGTQIQVETLDGVVNLRGFVRSLEQAARAGELARAVRGVTSVRNGLRVADRPSRA